VGALRPYPLASGTSKQGSLEKVVLDPRIIPGKPVRKPPRMGQQLSRNGEDMLGDREGSPLAEAMVF